MEEYLKNKYLCLKNELDEYEKKYENEKIYKENIQKINKQIKNSIKEIKEIKTNITEIILENLNKQSSLIKDKLTFSEEVITTYKNKIELAKQQIKDSGPIYTIFNNDIRTDFFTRDAFITYLKEAIKTYFIYMCNTYSHYSTDILKKICKTMLVLDCYGISTIFSDNKLAVPYNFPFIMLSYVDNDGGIKEALTSTDILKKQNNYVFLTIINYIKKENCDEGTKGDAIKIIQKIVTGYVIFIDDSDINVRSSIAADENKNNIFSFYIKTKKLDKDKQKSNYIALDKLSNLVTQLNTYVMHTDYNSINKLQSMYIPVIGEDTDPTA